MSVVDEDEVDTGEWEEFPTAKRSRRGVVLGILGGFAIVLLVGGFLGYRYVDAKVSPSGPAGDEVQVTIPSGANRDRIATILKQAGVIDSTRVFSWYVRFEGSGDFQAGDYTLRQHQGYKQILATLAKGSDVRPDRITIPEGFTLNQIATRVGRLPGRSAQKFLDAAASGQVRSQFSPAGNNKLEGLLFPDTYFVTPKDDELAILRRMVEAFDQQAVASGLVE